MPDIDGLRAFAVIVVILNHFSKSILPSGYLGVDIFFVISGYVITSSLSARTSKNFKDFIIGFFERRIKRLIPALIPFTLITGILICFFNPYPSQSLKTGITSLFGLSNFYLLKISTDYFASSTLLNAFTHTWSLDVEEQFYIVFPLLIWFTGFGKKTKNSTRNLIFSSIFLVSLSFSSYVYLFQINQSAAYFLMPTRFWEMAAGCLTFLFLEKKFLFISFISKLNSVVIFILLAGVLFLPVSIALFTTLLVVFLTSILIVCLKKGDRIYKLLTHDFSLHIGKISYSLYLWHWTVLCISRWTVGINLWTVPIQLALMYFISLFSYKYIELPFRKKEWSLKRWKTISKGIVILIWTAITLVLFGKPLMGKLYLGGGRFNIDNRWRYNITSANKKINGTKCNGDTSYTEEKINNIFENCIIKNPQNKSNKTVAFVGDSHVLAMMNSQKMIFDRGSNIIHYSYNGCPFPYTKYGIEPKSCGEFLKKSTSNLLKKLDKGDFIVINNYHLSHLGDKKLRDIRHNLYDKNKKLTSDGNKKIDIFIESLTDFSNKANMNGIKVILIGAGIRNNYLSTSTKEWFRPYPSPSSNDIYVEEKINANFMNSKLKYGVRNIENLIFVNPLKEIKCCKNDMEYHLFYRDTDHLSDYGSNVITKKLSSIIFEEEF